MGMAKKVLTVEAQAPVVEAATVAPSIPVTQVEKERVTKQDHKVTEKKVTAPKAVALLPAEKDSRILVQGVAQSILNSDWYAQQAALTDLSNVDSVKALREFAKQEIEYWVVTVKELAEKQ